MKIKQLEFGAPHWWERIGILFGIGAMATITRQIFHEWQLDGPSTVSLAFPIGFFFIYGFWCLYGLRFSRLGIWLPNGVAAILQVVFTAIIIYKAA